MGKTLLIFFISSLLLISSSQARGNEEKMWVAVVEFDEKGEVGIKDAGSIVAEWLICPITRTEKYETNPILKEKGQQYEISRRR